MKFLENKIVLKRCFSSPYKMLRSIIKSQRAIFSIPLIYQMLTNVRFEKQPLWTGRTTKMDEFS